MQDDTRRNLYDRVKAATVSICTRDGEGRYLPFGTGFNIDATGLVVTCEHVLAATLIDELPSSEEGPSLAVTQREWFCVFTVENDEGVFIRALRGAVSKGLTESDVAVVKLRRPDNVGLLPFVEVGDSDLVSEGELVLTCGFPLGGRLQPDAPTGALFARGIVAGVRPYRSKPPREKFLLDMTLNEGNSGGALVSEESGLAVGIVNARLREASGSATGISCAVPMNTIRDTIVDVRDVTIESAN